MRKTPIPKLRANSPSRLREFLPFQTLLNVNQAQRFHVTSVPLGKAEHAHSPETQEILDLAPLTLDEVVQLICEAWEHGLKGSMRFRVLISRMKILLAEGAGGKVAERKALEDADRIQIMVDSVQEDDGSSSTSWGESSNTRSMAVSEYTVRSIRSFKERACSFFRPRHNTR